jgi:hypothetical protein
LLLNASNPLKSDDSEERIQGKERKNKAQIQGKARKIQESKDFANFQPPAGRRRALIAAEPYT